MLVIGRGQQQLQQQKQIQQKQPQQQQASPRPCMEGKIATGRTSPIGKETPDKLTEHSKSKAGEARLTMHRSTIEIKRGDTMRDYELISGQSNEKLPLFNASQVVQVEANNRQASTTANRNKMNLDFINDTNLASSFMRSSQEHEESYVFASNALDLYKKSFNKSGGFYKEQKCVLEVTGRAKTPNNFANVDVNRRVVAGNSAVRHENSQSQGGSSALDKTTFHRKYTTKSNIPLPYAAAAKDRVSETRSFVAGQKFPKRSMPPQRQSLLLTKQNSGGQNYSSPLSQANQSNNGGGGLAFSSNIYGTQQHNSQTENDEKSRDVSVNNTRKRELQQSSSIHGGKYDTLKALNASETSKRLDEAQQFQKVIKKPKVRMLPVNRTKRSDQNIKSTLSNASFINKLCSTNRDINMINSEYEQSMKLQQTQEIGNFSGRTNSSLNQWKTAQMTSQNMSKDGAALDKNSGHHDKILEIKGSDGDQVMILQFDKQQLQVFNDILEKQIQDASKTSDARSATSSPGHSANITSTQKAVETETDEAQGVTSFQKMVSEAIANKRPQQELNLLSQTSSQEAGSNKQIKLISNSPRSGSKSKEVSYLLNASPQNQVRWIELRTNSFVRSESNLSRQSRSASSTSKRRVKKAVNLNDFVRSLQDESRMSSPSGPFDSPKTFLYLDAAKYNNQTKEQTTTVFTLGSDHIQPVPLSPTSTDKIQTDAGDRMMPRQPQSDHGDHKGIPVREFRVQLDSPTSLSKQSTMVMPPSVNSRQPRSFLQHLERQFGPNLVQEYLKTKDVGNMRKLMKLERSQHCNCDYRRQVNQLSQFVDEGLLNSHRDNHGSCTVGKAIQATPEAKDGGGSTASEPKIQSISSIERLQETYREMVTAQPCQNCIRQIQIQAMLQRRYDEQMQQKLEPVNYNLLHQQNMQIKKKAMTTRNNQSGTSIQKLNQLHHARYFKKQAEEKQVRDLKQQTILRKARQSTVLRVQPMNNLKSFDKHIQQCLTVKNDSALHRMALKKGGSEMGFLYPSVLSKQSTSSLVTANQQMVVGEDGLVQVAFSRASGDFTHKNDSVSNTSISPPPILNPKQSPLVDLEEKQSMSCSSSKNFSKRKFTLGKTRNGSTLTGGGGAQAYADYTTSKNTTLRDQLNRVLGSQQIKKRDQLMRHSYCSHHNVGAAAAISTQSQYGGQRNNPDESQYLQQQHAASIIEYNQLERRVPAPYIAERFDGEGTNGANQLDALRAAVKANNCLKVVDLQSKLPTDQCGGAGMNSIGASTFKLLSERGETMAVNLDIGTEEVKREDSYSHEPKRYQHVGNRQHRKSLVLTKQPQMIGSKVSTVQSNPDSHRMISSQHSSGVIGGSNYASSSKLDNFNNKPNSVMQSMNQKRKRDMSNAALPANGGGYQGVNFNAVQCVDIELERFFKQARKSALKLTYNVPLNGAQTSTNVVSASATDLHNSGDARRRGLKSQENNRSRVRRPFEAIKNNTRYCVSRERGKDHATFLVDASAKAIQNLINQEKQSQSHNASNKNNTASNMIFSTQKSTKKHTLHSRSLSKTSQGGLQAQNTQTRMSFNTTKLARSPPPVEFQALKPTILTPSSGMSITLTKDKELMGGPLHNQITKPNERCVKVNQHHIVVKEQPRKLKHMLYTAILDSEKQSKFMIRDQQNVSFFK